MRFPLTVAFDLNKTLVTISPREIKGRIYLGRYRKSYVYARDGLESMIEFLNSRPDLFSYGIWTSCMREKAQTVKDLLLAKGFDPLFVFDRSMCARINSKRPLKDPEILWRVLPGLCNRGNTLIVDDSPLKIPEAHRKSCLYEIPPFDPTFPERDLHLDSLLFYLMDLWQSQVPP